MQTETAVLAISDLHYGKKTTTFDTDIFKERMDALANRLGAIRKHLKGYEFDKLIIACLGDANDGTDIYAGQPHYQAVTDVEQQASELAEYLSGWTLKLRDIWGPVEWECVPGNHGRAGKWAAEAANWDTVAYRYMGFRLEKDNIPVNLGEKGQDPFLRKIFVRGHPILLYHGHDIRTFSNIPWYGMMLRISRWMSTQLAPISVALMGHFHTYGVWDINRVQVRCVGTAVTDDQWALRTFGWESAPKWHLFGVSDKLPGTWQYDVKLVE